MSHPLFFTLDGVDGAGKSTQIDLFVEWLRENRHEVVSCRDPGTTELGERLRQIVLESADVDIHPQCETLIYMAARAQLVEEIIRPALAEGKVVVSDRFLLANVVYQGYGFSLDIEQLWQVGRFATGEIEPTKTFVLDLDVDTAQARRQGTADRMERRDRDYFQRLRQGFLTEAQRQPERIYVIDANRSIAEIQSEIRRVASAVLPRNSS